MKILLLGWADWPSPARMPHELSRAGFEVHVLATTENILYNSGHAHSSVAFQVPFTWQSLLDQIHAVILRVAPILILPVDEISVDLLQRLFAYLTEAQPKSDGLPCLRRSLVREEFVPTIRSKNAIRKIANGCGVRIPPYLECSTVEVAVDAAKNNAQIRSDGGSLVLKADVGCGGTEVRICSNEADIRTAFNFLTCYAREQFMVYSQVVAERHIEGMSVIHSLAALEGVVLASCTYDVIERHPGRTGPSSVVRIADYPEIIGISQRFCEVVQFNGFCSFDFVIEDNSNLAYLLDFNPRQVATLHLGSITSRNLYQSLYNALAGLPPPPPVAKPFSETIALYPQELTRNRYSQYLHGYHDVPWDDPALVERLAHNARVPIPRKAR